MGTKIDGKVKSRSVSPTNVDKPQQKKATDKARPQETDHLAKNAPAGSKAKVLPAPHPQSPADVSVSGDDVVKACEKCAKKIRVPECKVTFLSHDENEINEVAELLADTFIEREPMARARAASSPTFRDTMHTFSLELTKGMADAGLTPIAKNAAGKVIGLLMISKFDLHPKVSQELPPESGPTTTVDSDLAPIFAILDQLEGEARKWYAQSGPEPRIIDLAMAAVHKDYQRKHIGELLVPVGVAKARHEGFNEVIAKATSNSQDILRNLGFETLAEVPYKTFEYNGQKPFESIDEPPSAMLMRAPISVFDAPQGKDKGKL